MGPADPMRNFATADNKIEQLLLQKENHSMDWKGSADMRRIAEGLRYSWMRPYEERVHAALKQISGPQTYVPGDEVTGESLRAFSDEPILIGPLVCHLCDADFVNERDFAKHKECNHAGDKEYRKRVLYLLSKAGCRPLTGQEKRLMVQNFARFQQFCRPGAKGNYFADSDEVPRAEAACAICAQKDWLENRHKLNLFGTMPDANDTELNCAAAEETENENENDEPTGHGAAPRTQSLLKHRGVYYLQSPETRPDFTSF